MFWSVESIVIIVTVGVSVSLTVGFVVGAFTKRSING